MNSAKPNDAEAGAIQVLPEMAFDLGNGNAPAGPGKTNAPVIVAPDLTFDLKIERGAITVNPEKPT